MKIITLNAWGGKIKNPFFEFIQKNRDIDVFCLQEIYKGGSIKEMEELTNITDANCSLYEDIERLLPDHIGIFCPVYLQNYGIAIFVKKGINIIDRGEVILYRNDKFPDPEKPEADHTRKMQWVSVEYGNGVLSIFNLHGHWVSGDKNDNPARIKQSEVLIDCLNKIKGPKILCGDFNLRPDTKSVQMIEKDMVNLVSKHNVKTTRTNLYTKAEKFADYIFVSPRIKVDSFKVMPDVVSDHAPLFVTVAE